MLAAALEGSSQPECVFLRHAGGYLDPIQPGPPFGERARLVADNRIDRAQAFDRLGVAEQDSSRGAPPRSHHDRHGSRQPQRAGARDDQHRYRRNDRVGERRLGAERQPQHEGQDGGPDDARHEPGGNPIDDSLDRRAASLGVGDHLHDS